MDPFTLPSFAKINLHLRIVGRRPDGYHDLCTVFQTISLRDTLTFAPADTIEFHCDSPNVPLGDGNLVVRAAKALLSRRGVGKGASIILEKRIPSPGGLGGGSSNAAVALVGLCRLWGIGTDLKELVEISSGLGSDVPFFLEGGTALGLGRGTELSTMPDVEMPHLLVVSPGVAVLTPDAFAAVGAASLTAEAAKGILQICRFEAEKLDFASGELRNDFENAVFSLCPEIAVVKRRLVELGARTALLSGSGASVFGIFEKEETRQTAMKALDDEVNWRKFAVATISRSRYRDALGLV